MGSAGWAAAAPGWNAAFLRQTPSYEGSCTDCVSGVGFVRQTESNRPPNMLLRRTSQCTPKAVYSTGTGYEPAIDTPNKYHVASNGCLSLALFLCLFPLPLSFSLSLLLSPSFSSHCDSIGGASRFLCSRLSSPHNYLGFVRGFSSVTSAVTHSSFCWVSRSFFPLQRFVR